MTTLKTETLSISWKSAAVTGLFQAFYAAIVCIASFFQLQLSCGISNILDEMTLPYLILSLCVLAIVFLLLSAPWRHICTGGILFATVSVILAIVNFYTLRLHGSILTVEELANARTAAAVIGQYNLLEPSLIRGVGIFLAIYLLCVLLSLAEYRFEKRSAVNARARWIRCGLTLVCAVILLLFMNSGKAKPYMKKARSSWQPTYTVQYHGYPVILYSAAIQYELTMPEGYSGEILSSIEKPSTASPRNTLPDIVLILNETFYDPAQVADIQTDTDYLGGIASLENALRGYAVAQSGGGTNITEFELLTSNPQSIVGGTPFNVLDLEDTASIVSLLKAQGYHTIGAHSQGGDNYHRTEGYPALGFDEIHFAPDYTDLRFYGSRPECTDESAYENLTRWYEDAQTFQKPVFAYCLTFQNHGGWDHNPPEEDLVQLQSYSGPGNQQELNEFLSCIKLSDQAFVDLCRYFETVDRPVIVCMVGDHSPAFVNQIISKDLGDAAQIRKAAVPFVIWANFDWTAEKGPSDYLSVTALGPLLLRSAGVSLSPFYQYALDLSKTVPVITDWGEYMDAQGTIRSYSDRSADTEGIWNYFYLSYNNLLPDSDDSWFTIPQLS